MIVCVCHRVSDGDIEREARAGCASFEALQDELRVATSCGACGDCARSSFECARAGQPATMRWMGRAAAASHAAA